MRRSYQLVVGLAVIGLLVGLVALAASHRLPASSAASISYTSGVPNRESMLLDVYETASGIRLFRAIADRAVAGKSRDLARLSALMEWTYENVRPEYAAPERFVADNSYRIVRRGFGYCDQAAHVFATLATYAGYRARIFFLQTADGASPHSVAQVRLAGRWIIVDPWLGVIPQRDGVPMTVKDLGIDPGALDRLGYRDLSVGDFQRGIPFETFPYEDVKGVSVRIWRKLVANGSRGGLLIARRTPLPAFVDSEEDEPEPPIDQRESLDEARRAHLEGRYGDAVALYRSLLAAEPQAEIAESAAFFLGMALLDDDDAPGAVEAFSAALERHPDTPWRKSLLYFRARAEERDGRPVAAAADYAAAAIPRSQLDLARMHSTFGA